MGFVGNLLGFPAVKEFWKSVKNWQSYCHEFGVQFFGPPCRGTKCLHPFICIADCWLSLTKFFELNTDNRTRDHSFAPLQLRSPSSLLLSKSCQSLEYVGSRHYICKDCEWLQVKIRIATKKKNGPVSGLKSAGPHGRFQSFGAAGSVTYLWV